MKPTTPTMHPAPVPSEKKVQAARPQHTAGPWSIQEPQSKLYANDREIVAPYQGKKPNAATSLVAKTSEANAARIVACVNAGIADPATAIPALVVALEEIAQHYRLDNQPSAAAVVAQRALALVQGRPSDGGKP